MKKIIVVVSVFVLSVMLMSIANHMTVVTVRYEDKVWYGSGVTYATYIKTETRLISGELVRENRVENVHWYQGLEEFLNDDESVSVSLNFR